MAEHEVVAGVVPAPDRVALRELPAELASRVMAATAHAECRLLVRRPGPGTRSDEYAVYALAGDRLVHMVLSQREDASVAETTETFVRRQIRSVRHDGDQTTVEVEAPEGRRCVVVPEALGRALDGMEVER